jgi:HEAT repeat protein
MRGSPFHSRLTDAARRVRRRLTVGRSMIAVLGIAIVVALVVEPPRQSAIEEFMAAASAPSRARLNPAVARIKALGLERRVGSALAGELRTRRTPRTLTPNASRTAMVAASTDLQVSIDVLYSLKYLGPEADSSVPELIRTLREDGSMYLRSEAARLLAVFAPTDRRARSAVGQLLRAQYVEHVARSAVGAQSAEQGLASLGSRAKGMLPILIGNLHDADSGTRWEAILLLRAIGPEAGPAIPALEAKLTDPDPRVRDACESILRRIRPTNNAHSQIRVFTHDAGQVLSRPAADDFDPSRSITISPRDGRAPGGAPTVFISAAQVGVAIQPSGNAAPTSTQWQVHSSPGVSLPWPIHPPMPS